MLSISEHVCDLMTTRFENYDNCDFFDYGFPKPYPVRIYTSYKGEYWEITTNTRSRVKDKWLASSKYRQQITKIMWSDQKITKGNF